MKKKVLFLFIIPLVVFLVGLIVVVARFEMAVAQVNRQEEKLFHSSVPDIGTTGSLTVLPLYEGAAGPGLASGPGVSYLVRTDDQVILMDLGFNPEGADPSALERNMRALGVSLDQVTMLFISHTHGDHVGAQNSFGGNTFWFSTRQPSLGELPIYTPVKMTYPGSQPVRVQSAMQLGRGVATSGPISYVNKMPAAFMLPGGVEQSLVVNVEGLGLVVISGCGHPGVQRTVSYVQKAFGQPVVGVIGGQHYTNMDAAALAPDIAFLQKLERVVALSPHDSGPQALAAFRNAFIEDYKDIVVGQEIVVK